MTLLNAPVDAKTAGQKTSVVGAIANSFLAVVQLIVGLISGSAALTADAFHTLADLASDAVAYVSVTIGQSEADDTHHYGHGKFESIGVMILSALLALAAIGISAQALGRLIEGDMVSLGPLPMAVAFVTLLVKEGLFRYTKYWADAFKSKVILVNAWHHRSDGITSAIVFLALGLNMIGLTFFDVLAALFITFMLLRMAWKNGKEAFNELVDAAVEEDMMEDIRTTILNTKDVRSCHYLRARRMGGDIYLDVHIEVAPYISVSEGHSIGDLAEERLKKKYEDIVDVTIHVDPYPDENVCYTNHPSRDALEGVIGDTFSQHSSKTPPEHIVLHTLPDELSADIFVAHTITKDTVKAIEKALTIPQGPFNKVRIYKKL